MFMEAEAFHDAGQEHQRKSGIGWQAFIEINAFAQDANTDIRARGGGIDLGGRIFLFERQQQLFWKPLISKSQRQQKPNCNKSISNAPVFRKEP